MLALSLVVAAVVAPLVFAQDATLGLQAIKAHFQQSALVPDLFSSFDPSALVTLTFPGAPLYFQLAQYAHPMYLITGVGELQPGQNLTRERTF
jgi:hypothetical protein